MDYLLNAWVSFLSDIHIFKRAGIAFLLSFALVIFFGKFFIRKLKRSSLYKQPIRDDGPETHLEKQNTPTLGGVLIMSSFFLSSWIMIIEINNIVKLLFILIATFSVIGLLDDLLKLKFKNSKGLPGKIKLLIGGGISLYFSYNMITLYPPEINTSVFFPFFSSFYVNIGIFYLIFTSFVILGTSNAANLTDGLDGLASIIVGTIFVAMLFICGVVVSPYLFTKFSYSSLLYYNDLQQMFIVIASIAGATLSFIWYNGKPAKIFMGDVGSLGIGSALGGIAVILKQELFLAVAALFLVLESLSVMIQVGCYKLKKKRVFLMAPLHHHFEQKGISEEKIVKRAWIFTVLMCVIGFLMLDL